MNNEFLLLRDKLKLLDNYATHSTKGSNFLSLQNMEKSVQFEQERPKFNFFYYFKNNNNKYIILY